MPPRERLTEAGSSLGLPSWDREAAPVTPTQFVCLLLIAATYWLACHRYTGIWHDAKLYNLLAARLIDPAAYSRDLFFTFGSQGSYSLFPPLFARLIEVFGMDLANRVVVISGALFWIYALSRLAQGMLIMTMPIYVAVLILVVTRASYSLNGGTFLLNENFATARSFAFPLALLSIAKDNSGRATYGLMLGALATVLHPLLGIWSLIVAVVRRRSDQWLAITGISLAILFALLVASSVAPVLDVMDAEWADRVQGHAPNVFAGGWGTLAVDQILFWIAACWAGGRFGRLSNRRLYLVVGLLAAWAVLLAQICSYWMPIHLVMEVQPARVLWLALVFGVFALVDSSWQVWTRSGNHRYWLLLAAIVLFCFREHGGAMLLGFLLIDFFGLWSTAAVGRWVQHPYGQYVVAVLILILLPTGLLVLDMDGLSIAVPWLDNHAAVKGLMFGSGGLAFVLLAWLANRVGGQVCLFVGGIFMLALTALNWDARIPRQLQTEARYTPGGIDGHPFAAQLRRGSVVAWIDHPTDIWFLLGGADYASKEQATGIVFSREKAIESMRRLDRLSVANVIDRKEVAGQEQRRFQGNAKRESVSTTAEPRVSATGIRYLCADPILDWVISDQKYPVARALVAKTIDATTGNAIYLYDCRLLRTRVGI